MIASVIPLAAKLSEYAETLGNMTYASYLLHFPIMLLIVISCSSFSTKPPFENPVFFVAFFAVILGASWWTFLRFERPAQHRVRRMLNT
jgi:peptidoglycan/LPS O-acetylase OafA/YrhL